MAELNRRKEEEKPASMAPVSKNTPPANLPFVEIADETNPAAANTVIPSENSDKNNYSRRNSSPLPRHLRDIKPEEIYEPEQKPPAVPVTAAMKEEAAALEALNLRPRHILPAAKRREMKYPAEHPSPRLDNDFHRYHRKILKAFNRARLPKIRRAEPGGYSFLRWLKKYTGLKKFALSQGREITDHNITIILSFARRKPTITANETAALLGVKPERATRYLEKLTHNGNLIGYSYGAKTYYQSVKY